MNLDKVAIGLGRRPALILVDMINAFTDHSCPLGTDCPDVIAANQALLTRFRADKRPVFYTTVAYRSSEDAFVFRQRLPALDVLQHGSHWVEVDSRLAMVDGETLVEKTVASAFHGTDLDQQLRARNVDSLVVTGLTTSGCVRATAVDGLQNNFKVVVASDAVGDRNHDAHKANLFDLSAKYADVLDNQSIFQLLDKLN